VAFQQYDGPLMGMLFLEFRGTKQFFRKDCFFLWRWVAFGSGFCGVLLAVGHSFPYLRRLFRRERLGNEKKFLRRTSLPENGSGHQVSLLAACIFEKRLCSRHRVLAKEPILPTRLTMIIC